MQRRFHSLLRGNQEEALLLTRDERPPRSGEKKPTDGALETRIARNARLFGKRLRAVRRASQARYRYVPRVDRGRKITYLSINRTLNVTLHRTIHCQPAVRAEESEYMETANVFLAAFFISQPVLCLESGDTNADKTRCNSHDRQTVRPTDIYPRYLILIDQCSGTQESNPKFPPLGKFLTRR